MVTSNSFIAKHPALYLKRIGAAGRSFRGLWNPDKPCAIGAENHVFEVLAVKLHAVTSTCNLYILIKKAGIPAFFEHFRYFSNFQFNKFFN